MYRFGTVRKISTDSHGKVTKIYLNLDDEKAGLKLRNSDVIAKRNKWVPIERVVASIKLKVNKDYYGPVSSITFKN